MLRSVKVTCFTYAGGLPHMRDAAVTYARSCQEHGASRGCATRWAHGNLLLHCLTTRRGKDLYYVTVYLFQLSSVLEDCLDVVYWTMCVSGANIK